MRGTPRRDRLSCVWHDDQTRATTDEADVWDW